MKQAKGVDPDTFLEDAEKDYEERERMAEREMTEQITTTTERSEEAPDRTEETTARAEEKSTPSNNAKDDTTTHR